MKKNKTIKKAKTVPKKTKRAQKARSVCCWGKPCTKLHEKIQQIARKNETWKQMAQTFAKNTKTYAQQTSEKRFWFCREKKRKK